MIDAYAAMLAADNSAKATRVTKGKVNAKLSTKLTNVQAILSQTNADIRADPAQEIKELSRIVRILINIQLGKFEEASTEPDV